MVRCRCCIAENAGHFYRQDGAGALFGLWGAATHKTKLYVVRKRWRIAVFLPVKRAEHRRKSGGCPSRLSGGVADAPFRGGPDFREAQGTTVAAGGGRARVPGSPFFADFLWRSKESQSACGTNSRPKSSPRAARTPIHRLRNTTLPTEYPAPNEASTPSAPLGKSCWCRCQAITEPAELVLA